MAVGVCDDAAPTTVTFTELQIALVSPPHSFGGVVVATSSRLQVAVGGGGGWSLSTVACLLFLCFFRTTSLQMTGRAERDKFLGLHAERRLLRRLDRSAQASDAEVAAMAAALKSPALATAAAAPQSSSSAASQSSSAEATLRKREVAASELVMVERAGAGASAEVWVARWGNAHVAAKCLHRAVLGDAARVAAFLREALLLIRVAHPLVIKLQAVVLSPPHVALLLELADRGSVRSLLDSSCRSLSWRDSLCSMAAEAAEAVAHVHALHIRHADLKASLDSCKLSALRPLSLVGAFVF
jgi:hypothetical protein